MMVTREAEQRGESMQTLEVPQLEQWTPELLESLPDEFRYEVREGNLVVMNAAMRPFHSKTQHRVVSLLGDLAYAEAGVALGSRELRTCDVGVFYQQPPGDRAYHQPDDFRLVVAIVSPSSEYDDRLVKPVLYVEAGISQFWLVEESAEQVVLVHRYELHEGTYEL